MICRSMHVCGQHKPDKKYDDKYGLINISCINSDCSIAPAYFPVSMSTERKDRKLEQQQQDIAQAIVESGNLKLTAAMLEAQINAEKTVEAKGHKHDDGKLRFDLIPPIVEQALATILTFGAAKYGPNNWQTLPDFKPRFTGALLRHLNAWRHGEKKDRESGESHLWHALCNIAFLIWKEADEELNNSTIDKLINKLDTKEVG